LRHSTSPIAAFFNYTVAHYEAAPGGFRGPLEQENRMVRNRFAIAGIRFAIVFCSLVLGACGREQETPADAAREAALANVEAMSREHANDTTDPSPAVDIAPARPVVSQSMAYTESKDELVYGYFSAPADMFEPLPAVIMIHEWWGLNDNIRAMADRLAGEGYIVFAVDLFNGDVASSPAEARLLMTKAIEEPEAVNQNIRAAFNFVSDTAGAPRIGVVGWCFGGGWSLNTARLFPEELDASVIYYGQVTDDEDALRPIGAPILGLFGANDAGIKVESVRAFDAALTSLGKNHEVHIYPGVGHAFANPTGANYNAAAADDAWRRTLAFLKLHLSVGET
jgi:carboxymethylenebutenolidase